MIVLLPGAKYRCLFPPLKRPFLRGFWNKRTKTYTKQGIHLFPGYVFYALKRNITRQNAPYVAYLGGKEHNMGAKWAANAQIFGNIIKKAQKCRPQNPTIRC
jgi:hypothetical protein